MTWKSELLWVVVATVVAASAVLGGAYSPGARLWIGLLLTGVAAWSVMVWSWSLRWEEVFGIGVIGWGAVAAAVHHGNPLASKEMLAGWTIAWLLFVVSSCCIGSVVL